MKLLDHLVGRVRVGEIYDEHVDQSTGVLVPDSGSDVERLDRDEALDTHLVVVLAPYEVVADRDIVAALAEM
jgi:hypothetical protein